VTGWAVGPSPLPLDQPVAGFRGSASGVVVEQAEVFGAFHDLV